MSVSVSRYSKGVYNPPNRDIDPKDKLKPEYSLANAQYILSVHARGKSGNWGSSEVEDNRAYLDGNQSEEIYKDFLNLGGSESTPASINGDGIDIRKTDGGLQQQRKGFMNLDYNIFSVMPKILNKILGVLRDVDFSVTAEAIDEKSGAESESKKYQSLVGILYKTQISAYRMRAGISEPQEMGLDMPRSYEEFKMFEASEGFKPNFCKVTETVVEHSFNLSHWDDIKEKLIRDSLSDGLQATRDYYDDETGTIKSRYVDIANLVIQYSDYDNYRNSEYAGELHFWTISQLRLKMPEVEESIWFDLAETNNGIYGNDGAIKTDNDCRLSDGTMSYDSWRVQVFEAEWKDVDKIYKTINTDKRGDINVFDQKKRNVRNSERNKTRITNKRIVYTCFLVLGTELIFDYGLVENQIRKSPSEPILSFHVRRLPSKAIVPSLKPILNAMQNTWLKFQNAIAKSWEQGYALDTTMLSNLVDGNKKYNFLDIIKMWRETGVLLFQTNTIDGMYAGGSSSPATPLQGGMGTAVDDLMKSMDAYTKMIEDLIGFSPVYLGATPDPNAPVGTTEQSLQSTNDALKSLIGSIFEVKEETARNVMLRYQLGIGKNKKLKEGLRKVIGAVNLNVIEEAKSAGVEYGIRLEAKANFADKNDLLQQVNISLEGARQGRPGLSVADGMEIKHRIMTGGNLRDLRSWVGYVVKKAEDKAFAQQQQLVEQQQQGNMQMKEEESRRAAEKVQLETQKEVTLEKLKHQSNMELEQFKANAEFRKSFSASNRGGE